MGSHSLCHIKKLNLLLCLSRRMFCRSLTKVIPVLWKQSFCFCCGPSFTFEKNLRYYECWQPTACQSLLLHASSMRIHRECTILKHAIFTSIGSDQPSSINRFCGLLLARLSIRKKGSQASKILQRRWCGWYTCEAARKWAFGYTHWYKKRQSF